MWRSGEPAPSRVRLVSIAMSSPAFWPSPGRPRTGRCNDRRIDPYPAVTLKTSRRSHSDRGPALGSPHPGSIIFARPRPTGPARGAHSTGQEILSKLLITPSYCHPILRRCRMTAKTKKINSPTGARSDGNAVVDRIIGIAPAALLHGESRKRLSEARRVHCVWISAK